MTERLDLTDTAHTAVIKLAEGNPGALAVLLDILARGSKIDPEAGFGNPVFILLNIDSLGLYGPRIWMLFNDVCGRNLSRTIAFLRFWQMGYLTKEQLFHAVDNRGGGVDVKILCDRLKADLPSFNFQE